MYQLEYLLALLNSQIFQWRFKLTSSNNNVATNELESMPFRTIDFAKPADKSRHDRLVDLAEQMQAAKARLPLAKTERDREFYTNKCATLDQQIDALVYELYGLTDEEIKLVEGNA